MNFQTYAIDQFWSSCRSFAAAATKAFRPGLPVVVRYATHQAWNLMASIPLLMQNG